jgi:hypothetical protein
MLAMVLEEEREPTRLELLALQSDVPYWTLRMYLADEVERRRAVAINGDGICASSVPVRPEADPLNHAGRLAETL